MIDLSRAKKFPGPNEHHNMVILVPYTKSGPLCKDNYAIHILASPRQYGCENFTWEKFIIQFWWQELFINSRSGDGRV